MNELNKEIKQLAFTEAEKFKLTNQTKLHEIEVDDEIFYSILPDFIKQNDLDAEINIGDAKELLKRAFPYFHDKGVETALQTHFGGEVAIEYDNDNLVNLIEPDFPTSIRNYINDIALLQISETIYNELVNQVESSKTDFLSAVDAMLYAAFKLGAELINQIHVKNSDFDLSIIDIENERDSYLQKVDDMLELNCPFCDKVVFVVPKDPEYNRLTRFNNCNHIYVQYHEGIDEKFSMQQNTKDQLSQVAQEFIASKGLPMVQRLNLLDGKRDYTVDDFLEDLYVNNIFEKIEEEEYIARYRELCSNYEIKVSVEDVHGENLITYFQSEKF